MAKDPRELFIAWLKDAYAMEKSVEEVLESHAKDAKEYPQLQAKIEEHLEITKTQGEKVKSIIEDMGESVSKIKAFSSGLMGKMQGAASKFAEDKIIKNTLAEIATEAYEIATYRTLIMAAEQLGESSAVDPLKEILSEEEKMSSWAQENLPMLIEEFFVDKAIDELEENL